MLIDKKKFATHLRKNAAKLSQRKCATYVRRALEARGARTVGHPVDAKDYGPVLLIWLCLTTSVAYAVEPAPTTLLVPVVGVRYTVATALFDPLPDGVISMCPGLVADENMRGVFWIYATARDRDSVYYVIGGYGVRARPDLPDFPRYALQDLGTVVQIRGQDCVVLGEAEEVFRSRYFAETPQRVLQSLAEDLVQRLAVALGGMTKMHAELRRQHVNVDNISPEVSEAFASGR